MGETTRRPPPPPPSTPSSLDAIAERTPAPRRDPAQHPRGEVAFIESPAYEMDIGAHVFPTRKFRLVREELVRRGLLKPARIYLAPEATEEELLRAMDRAYFDDFTQLRRTARTAHSELPLTAQIVRGFVTCAGGTLLAARLALRSGLAACHLGGGFHHAFRDHAEGFCYINDLAVAACTLLEEGAVERIAIVDVDLHQGNGTAGIFRDEPRVYTFSIHQEDLYPFKERSDWDIGLADHTGGVEYLARLEAPLAHIVGEFRPQLVLYVGGVDPYREDQLGSLALTIDDMRARDRMCLGAFARAGIPFVTVTAGGYAVRVADTVTMHANTIEEALRAAGAAKDDPRRAS